MIDFTIKSGQLVRIKLGGETYLTGPCVGNRRKTTGNLDYISYTYDIADPKTLLTKRNINKTFAASVSYSSIVVDPLVKLADLGITSGYIASSGYTQEAIVCEGQMISELLDNLAGIDGCQWYLTNDLELVFAENPDDYSAEANIIKAPYCLDNENIFDDTDLVALDDYQNIEIEEDYTNYANQIQVIGAEYAGKTIKCQYYNKVDLNEFVNVCGYGAGSVYVVSDTNIVLNPDVRVSDTGTNTGYIYDWWSVGSTATVVRSGDMIYNKTRGQYSFITTVTVLSSTNTAFYIHPAITAQTSGDYLHYNYQLNELAKRMIKVKSEYPPLLITFETFRAGFFPRQRLFVNLPELDTIAYFNINSVSVSDLSAGKFKFTIMGEKKNYSDNFSTITHRSFTKWFKNF